MQGQQTILRPGLASQKAMNYPPPRPSTAPTAPQPRMPRKSLTNLSSSNSSSSLDSGTSSSRSEGSDSHDSGSESSSDFESRQESDADHPRLRRRAHEHKKTASDQLPEPLRKLQQQSFTAGGTHADPMAEPSGLVWQGSGFMIPFTPEMFGPKGGQHWQISTAATGVTSVPGRGKHHHYHQHICSLFEPATSHIVESAII